MAKTPLSFLANHPLPVEVGSIGVSPDGTPVSRARPALEFSFDYTGTEFVARVEPADAGGASLRLDAVLAAMPYTAEDRGRRRDVQLIMRASRQGMHHGRFVLDGQRRIHLVTELTIGSPVTSTALISTATRLLIAATPWIALLRKHLGPLNAAAAARPTA